jgi:hypothetical protein
MQGPFTLLNSRFELRSIDAQTGDFAGYASVFGQADEFDTVFDWGCFDESLAEHAAARTMPKLLWQHDWSEVIGRWIELHEDATGLWAQGRLDLRTQRGREAAALLEAAPLPALDGLSIGFQPIGYEKNDDGRWHFTNVRLMEASLVTFQAMPGARVQRALTADDIVTQADLGAALQRAGLAASDAEAVAQRFAPDADAGGGDDWRHVLEEIQRGAWN